jgi:hypothetical protein
MPSAAQPMANPAIPCSVRGVLKILSDPNSSNSFKVQRKTPPKATSSPKTRTFSDVFIECLRAALIAWKRLSFSEAESLGRPNAEETDDFE